MPHYADGTEAKVGDLVIGNGYNESKNKKIAGVVSDVRPGDTCTLTVVFIHEDVVPEKLEPWQVFNYRNHLLLGGGNNVRGYTLKVEYGDTKGFNRV